MLPLQALQLGLALFAVYSIIRILYNLFFHPLAKFPGPRLAAISNVWYCLQWKGGKFHLTLDQLHLQYGDVIRIAPNELSIASPQAAKDIYGVTAKGAPQFLKGDFYKPPTGDPSIVTHSDPKKHLETRRLLSHAFSAKALRLQTDLIIYYTDMFVKQLEKFGSDPAGVSIDEWYNWLTFDIVGDLTFGESFNAVSEAKTPFWIYAIFNSAFALILIDSIRRIPAVTLLAPWLLPESAKLRQEGKKHKEMTIEKVRSRRARDNTRDDFYGKLLSEKHPDVGEPFLLANSNTLIVAGSETTATALAGVTFYLLREAHCWDRLKQEVRGAFASSSGIGKDSTAALPYLTAVIEESLRIYPPVPIGLPRVSPGGIVDGHYVSAGTTVHTPLWTISHSPKWWHAPDEFRPERWLSSDDPDYITEFSQDNKDASKPFLLGPRGCLGQNLAYVELRIILAKLVWHFDWELVSKDYNWERDNKMYIIWHRTAFKVRMIKRQD